MSSGIFGNRGPQLDEKPDNRKVPGIGHTRAKLREDRMASKYVGNSLKASKTQTKTKGGGKKGC